jgi:FKBP-type peptidyl-prolyl cis-trans isomerase
MARMRERIFAGFGALLFLGSACALTIYVVVSGQGSNNTNTNNQTSQQQCSDTQTETALTAPTAYIPSGPVTTLQTTDLTAGSGPAAKSGDCLVVKYYGTLASNGKEFDQDFTNTAGFAFTLGQGQVIQGWDQGMAGMKAGGTRRLVIPASLAYGSQSPSAAIPANSDLVFVVKLLRIQN